jgi:hypothetical protein
MKAFKYIFALSALLVAVSCVKPGAEAIHDDNTIQSIRIYKGTDLPTGGNHNGVAIAGDIDPESNEIYFTIPRRDILLGTWDRTKIKIEATVGYDVMITPSLVGIHDMTTPMTITATSGTGKKRSYILYVEEGLQ